MATDNAFDPTAMLEAFSRLSEHVLTLEKENAELRASDDVLIDKGFDKGMLVAEELLRKDAMAMRRSPAMFGYSASEAFLVARRVTLLAQAMVERRKIAYADEIGLL